MSNMKRLAEIQREYGTQVMQDETDAIEFATLAGFPEPTVVEFATMVFDGRIIMDEFRADFLELTDAKKRGGWADDHAEWNRDFNEALDEGAHKEQAWEYADAISGGMDREHAGNLLP